MKKALKVITSILLTLSMVFSLSACSSGAKLTQENVIKTVEIVETALKEFLRTVPVGRGQFGINSFLDCYLDSLLTCGRAVGEIVPAVGNRDIAALVCGRVEDIEIKEGQHPLAFSIWGPDETGKMAELPYQELLLFTPLNPETDNPYGVSLLRSLPFLTDILMKIYHAIGLNW